MRGCGCAHSDKSWAGIGLLLSQAEEEKLHPFLPLERKRRMSSVLCPWSRSDPQFSGCGAGQQRLQGQQDISANIVPTTVILSLSPHPHPSPAPFRATPQPPPRTEHRAVNAQCWGHPPPCRIQKETWGIPERRKKEIEPVCTGSSKKRRGTPLASSTQSRAMLCASFSARLSKLILVKMSP